MSNFNIGDRVRTKTLTGKKLSGLTGTVVDMENDWIGVKFDVNISNKYGLGHSCEGWCEYGYGYYIYEKELELIEETPLKIRWYSKGKFKNWEDNNN